MDFRSAGQGDGAREKIILKRTAKAPDRETPLPRVLCMVDLSRVPQAIKILREATQLDYRPADRSLLLDIIADYDAYWAHVDIRVDREVLERAKRLKVINTSSTGTDHIDVEEAERRGIRILSLTRDYGLLSTFTATAECAWMLLLACFRHLRPALRHVLEGKWRSEQFCGRQLSGHTLGILGVGRLGNMIANYGRAFGMQVLGCDTRPFGIPFVKQVSFDELLRQSDAISIHLHMTPNNYHLFDARAFSKMKAGAVLVNTSRGDIIDEPALLSALRSGRLAAFGADVLHDEWREDMGQSPVVQYAREHDNVILTPHIGGCTEYSLVEARTFSARKLVHYLKTGKELAIP